jgi:hypothetical protein
MWILIAALVAGDVLVAALLIRERRSHHKSRVALDYWRKRHGLTIVPLESVENDMARMRAQLRGRVQRYRSGRVASGDAA